MAISRKHLFGKLNATLFKSVESATTLCKLRGNPYVELVHWLNQTYQQPDCDLRHIIRHFELDAERLERDFAQALTRLPSGASSISDFSWHIEQAIERAWVFASLECQAGAIRSGHLLMALLTSMELRRALFGISTEFEKIPLDQLNHDLDYIIRDASEQDALAGSAVSGGNAGIPGEASGALEQAGQGGGLAQYSTDLTALAKAGKIDPVLGRDREINTMVDILLRRRQNNPLLTGEAGVGKTAVVEGLALAIAAGEVPPSLENVRLLTLDVVALSAGASMKGEFEARLKGVLEEAVSAADPVILFIDEVHTLVGAGGNAGTGDAANLMKPMLARGQLRTIGATTWSEFKRHIEKDPALTRRFQVLQVEEPDEALAVAMVRGLLPVLEQHHGVWIMDEAIRAAVRLSHRYIPARQLPDKAISLLDTACARVAVAQHTPPEALQLLKFRTRSARAELAQLEKAIGFGKEDDRRQGLISSTIAENDAEAESLDSRWSRERELVTAIIDTRQQLLAVSADAVELRLDLQQQLGELEAALSEARGELPLVQAEVNAGIVASIVANWTGIPVGQVLKDDVSAVMELPRRLAERVIGQPYALECLSQSIQTARAGLADPKKPFGVFMLAGPSGVGKTETALAIASQLYGGEQNLITINMSEYQEAHTVSSLKGSPPGYVGYGEGGVLTEAVRRKPYSVILLDEVEKAHPDVHELFYQVFDKGSMEDGEGRHIDFRNTVILLTSNSGSEIISSACADPETMPDETGLLTLLQPALLKVFPAAFLGRVTVIPYLPLAASSLRHIVNIHLQRIAERAKANYDIDLTFSDELVQHVVDSCPVAETGARMLIRFIEKNILPKIGVAVLSGHSGTAINNEGIAMHVILSSMDDIEIIYGGVTD